MTTRALRSDAQRNRERLLTEAAAAFSADGVDVALEDIARRADVGIATLYRHFPTRDALIEAVYRREVERICDAATDLMATRSPADALSAWLQLFVEYVAAKRGMATALKSVVRADSDLFAYTHGRMTAAITGLVEAAVADGSIRSDIQPLDLLRAVSGVCLATEQSGKPQAQAGSLVGLLMDGMRYRPTTSA